MPTGAHAGEVEGGQTRCRTALNHISWMCWVSDPKKGWRVDNDRLVCSPDTVAGLLYAER